MQLRPSREQGNTLLVCLVTVVIMGFSMASYLDLVANQNQATMRSQQWNAAIPVLEAGIEEALTHLHHNPTNRAENGWIFVNGFYTKERFLGESKYVVTISDDPKPVILAQAYVKAPMSTDFMKPPRTVRVTVSSGGLFAKGMVAKGVIELNGNGVSTDSFDSVDPNHSTGGLYDWAKRKDSGDVATNSSLVDSLDVWNAKIMGRASTGPGGTVKIGPQGVVGSKQWHADGKKGLEPGWSSDDMNVEFPDVEPPFSGGASVPAPGTVGGTNYNYVLTAGNWQMSSLSMSGSSSLFVTNDAVLYVTGNFSMSGQSKILIANDSSLKLYVGGPSGAIGGNGVSNAEGNANNFYYYGLPNHTSLSFSGNAAFIGVIYAPHADFHLNGGGNNQYDFIGASITETVQMNGHFNFHFDENLSRVGPTRGFTIESWDEVFSWAEL